MTGMEAIKQAVVVSLEKQGKLSQLKVRTATRQAAAGNSVDPLEPPLLPPILQAQLRAQVFLAVEEYESGSGGSGECSGESQETARHLYSDEHRGRVP